MTYTKACLVLPLLGAVLLSSCATPGAYSYQTSNRVNCAANLAFAQYAINQAADVEETFGVDVDAYDGADQFAFWSNMFLAGFNAVSAGRSPDLDDACYAVNETADFTYSRDY